MPSRTGFSHAVAAVVVVIVGPVLSRFIELLIMTRDIQPLIESSANLVSTHPLVPLSDDYTTAVLYLVIVGILAFVWGYAYHIQRYGSG